MVAYKQGARISTADALRAIACLLVVSFHFGGLVGRVPGMALVYESTAIGWIGVQMFFVLSGFIVPYSMYRAGFVFPRDCTFFLARRLVRLDPPYFVASFLAAFIAYLAALTPAYRGAPPDITWERSLAHIGYLNGILGMRFYDLPCWTLGIEFQFYLIAAVLYPLFGCKRPSTRISLHAGILAATYVGCTRGVISLATDDASCWILSWAPFFVLGIASFQRFVQISSNVEYWSVAAAAFVISLLTGTTAGAWAGTSTAVLLTYGSFPSHPLITKLAAISYSLYLTHSPIGERLIRLVLRIDQSPLWATIAILSAIVASLGAAYLLYRYTELPALRWASYIRLSGHERA